MMSVLTAWAAPQSAQSTHRCKLESGLDRLTPAERAERGKEARAAVPRESHAEFDPGPGGPKPDRSAGGAGQVAGAGAGAHPTAPGRDGLPVHLLPRSGAADGQRPFPYSGVRAGGAGVRGCALVELRHFGSADRLLVFDVNDFDETTPGPWEWDVKRLAPSMEVAARGNGFGRKDRREIVTATVTSYRQAMRDFAKMTDLAVWYAHADLDQLQAQFNSQMKKRQRKMVSKGTAKARTRDNIQELAQLTHPVDGRPQITADPPLIVPIADLLPEQTDQKTFEAQIKVLLAGYRRTLETDRRLTRTSRFRYPAVGFQRHQYPASGDFFFFFFFFCLLGQQVGDGDDQWRVSVDATAGRRAGVGQPGKVLHLSRVRPMAVPSLTLF